MDTQDNAPEPTLMENSPHVVSSGPSKLTGFKNIFVMVSFVCLALAVVGSLVGWVKVNIDLSDALTSELALSTKRNTVLVLSVVMAAVVAVTAYIRLRWLAIFNLVVTAFAVVVVFNQRIASADAEIAKNTVGWILCLLALLVNFVVTVGIVATLRKNSAV